jgi:SlyX protein
MTDHANLQQRLIELETRLAFQEHALQEMSDTVARQQKETQERLRGIAAPTMERADEPPPPHY